MSESIEELQAQIEEQKRMFDDLLEKKKQEHHDSLLQKRTEMCQKTREIYKDRVNMEGDRFLSIKQLEQMDDLPPEVKSILKERDDFSTMLHSKKEEYETRKNNLLKYGNEDVVSSIHDYEKKNDDLQSKLDSITKKYGISNSSESSSDTNNGHGLKVQHKSQGHLIDELQKEINRIEMTNSQHNFSCSSSSCTLDEYKEMMENMQKCYNQLLHEKEDAIVLKLEKQKDEYTQYCKKIEKDYGSVLANQILEMNTLITENQRIIVGLEKQYKIDYLGRQVENARLLGEISLIETKITELKQKISDRN
ncbi:hypothetical protein WA158_004877 [Blastocystis sp. Blastoise]